MIDRRSCLASGLLALLPLPALATEAASGLNTDLEPIRLRYGFRRSRRQW